MAADRFWTLAVWSVDSGCWMGLFTTDKGDVAAGMAAAFGRDVPWAHRLVEVPAPGTEVEVAKALDSSPEPVFGMADVARAMWWLEGLYVQRDVHNSGEVPS